MPRTAARQRVQSGLMWLVIVVSLALLTPWGLAHRHALEPRFELVAIVFGTLSCAAFLVTGVLALVCQARRNASSRRFRFAWRSARSCVVATFMWARSSPVAQSYTLARRCGVHDHRGGAAAARARALGVAVTIARPRVRIGARARELGV